MKKAFLASIILGVVMLNNSIAQELEHLRPVQVTEISLVRHDSLIYKNPIAQIICADVDTSITFFECLNAKGIVGYLLDYHHNKYFRSFNTIWGNNSNSSEGTTIHVGLKEVQQTENLLAKELDLKTDSAQRIPEVFTAPRFYQSMRQYIFYVEADGDTCVMVNCVAPDETDCIRSRYLAVLDGGDEYWHAVLNLSKKQVLFYSINGPMLYIVKGRSKEPHGLKGLQKKSFFHYGNGWDEKLILYSKLPKLIRTKIKNSQDINKIYRQTSISGKHYYTIFIDSIQQGYRSDGKCLFIASENLYSGDLPAEKLQEVPYIEQMLNYIHEDMSRRGRNFDKYGKLLSLEVVRNHYIIHIWYYPDIDYYKMWAAYTFDCHGKFIGIDISS
ncbi:MAG: hypothetical protein IKP54_11530 [Bacteroidales bacterium]|nr:hypothetical protein [Bacteroidales bacterium]